MEEKFDKQLSDHIQSVFEEYEDASADEGWNQLRQKYPEKERRIFTWWWTSFAAASLLLLGFWLFWPVENSIHNLKSVQNKQKIEILKPGKNLNNVGLRIKNVYQKKHINFPPSHQNETKQADKFVASNPVSNPVKYQKQESKNFTNNNLISFLKKRKQLELISNQHSSENGSTNLKNSYKDSLEKENPINANFVPLKEALQLTFQQPITNQNLIFQPEIKLPVKTVFVVKISQVKKQDQHQSKFSFGIYADTHLNFANGSNNQFGYGTGFSADYQLAKKLQLSTGLALIQNKLNYTNNFPQNTQPAVTYFSTPASGVTTTSNIQSLNNVAVNLLVLDLPINLKYQLYSGKNSIYVAAGISSNAFVNESYSYNYNNSSALSSLPSQTSTLTTSAQQSVNISKSFKSFDFARTLNLSFGFAYPLGKNQIQVEPFLKYPLAGLGSQQLLFGLGGINIKFNFQSKYAQSIRF